MNRHRLFERAIAVFPPGPGVPEELLLVQLDALAGLKRWQELSDLLARVDLDLDPVLLALYRGRVALELGNRPLYDLGWKQALRAGERDPRSLRYLADYAEKMKEPVRSVQAYEALAGLPGHEVEALMRLVRLHERLGQTRMMFDTLQRLLKILPTDPIVNSDFAYVALLLGDTSVQPHERARVVYAVNPRLPAFAATYALAQWKGGLPVVALQSLEHVPREEWTVPGWHAVYAAVLAANGRQADAKRVAAEILSQPLLPEERKLIEGLLPKER